MARLIGTSPNQVPLNSMLGSMAFQNKEGLSVDRVNIFGTTENIATNNTVESWYLAPSASTYVSVSGQDTEPRDIFFSSDGTKLYMIGNTNNTIYQYTVSTPWSISSYVSTPAASYNVGTSTALETNPLGMYIDSSGTRLYVCGTGVNPAVHQFTLGTAWSLGGTVTFVRTLNVSAQESTPSAVQFSTDGTRMFVLGGTGDDITQYNLSTAWDISTAAAQGTTLSVASYETDPQGISFNSTGTKVWVVGATSTRILEFNLSTPWTITSGTSFVDYGGVYYQTVGETVSILAGVSGIYVNIDQNKAWISDYSTDRVYELTIQPVAQITGKKLFIDTDHVEVKNNLLVNKNAKFHGPLVATNGATILSLTSNTISTSASTSTLALGTTLTTGILNLATGLTTGTLDVGGTAATGTMTFGRSTDTQTIGLATGAVASTKTKTVNIGTGGVSGSTTQVNIGSSAGTSTVTINGNIVGDNPFSITRFGTAVGDGTTNNNALFTTIEARSETNFYLPEGTYFISDKFQVSKTYWGPGRLKFSDGYIQKGVDFTDYPPRNVDGHRTITAPGDLVLNPNGNVTFAGKRIQNIGTPLGALDAVNLSYIDTYLEPRIVAAETSVSSFNTTFTNNNLASVVYATGSFTPVIIGGDTAGTGTYESRTATWTRIGRLVTIKVSILFTDHTGSGGITVTGYNGPAIPALSNEIGTVLHTFPIHTDTPNNQVFSVALNTGNIDFYRKPLNGAYTTLLSLPAPHSGTCPSAGTTNTIVLATGANANNDYYVERTIKITAGTGAGQERRVKFYNGSTKTATMWTNWTTTPDNTSQYTVTCSGSIQTELTVEI